MSAYYSAAYRELPHAPPLVLAGAVQPDAPVDRPPGIELLGLTPPDVVLKLMRVASMVIVPSIVLDACPTVVLEAMAAGRPVVASSSGGIVDLVEDGVTGILVPPENPSALAKALTSLIEDPGLAMAMGRKGLERVRGIYGHCHRGPSRGPLSTGGLSSKCFGPTGRQHVAAIFLNFGAGTRRSPCFERGSVFGDLLPRATSRSSPSKDHLLAGISLLAPVRPHPPVAFGDSFAVAQGLA